MLARSRVVIGLGEAETPERFGLVNVISAWNVLQNILSGKKQEWFF